MMCRDLVQHRLEHRPDGVGDDRAPCGVRMDAVAPGSAPACPATLSSRNGTNVHARTSARVADTPGGTRRCTRRRSSAAPPCRPGSPRRCARWARSMICARFFFISATDRPRRPSLPPSATTRTRDVALERPVEPAQAARRRVARHAGVDDLELVAVGVELLLQERRIRLRLEQAQARRSGCRRAPRSRGRPRRCCAGAAAGASRRGGADSTAARRRHAASRHGCRAPSSSVRVRIR